MSFRDFLTKLNKEGRLKRISKEVSPVYDAASIMSELDGSAVYFDRIEGSKIPVAGGFCSSRGLIAESLGIRREEILFTLANAIENRKEPSVVEGGFCQEIIEKDPDLTRLPLFKFVEGDGGKYITSAIAVINDPALGDRKSVV